MKPQIPLQIKLPNHPDKYDLVLLRVEDRNPDGSPLTVTILKPNDVAELSRDMSKNDFYTAFVSETLLKSRA